LEKGARARVFGGKGYVDEVAGDRDMVGGLRFEVGDDAREHVGFVDQAAFALPVEVAGEALADEFGKPRLGQGC
jgi:hypothetical protein